MCWILGLAASRFDAWLHKPLTARAKEDRRMLPLTTSDGSMVSIARVASGKRTPGKERFELFGGGRFAVVNDFRELRLFGGGRHESERTWLAEAQRRDEELETGEVESL